MKMQLHSIIYIAKYILKELEKPNIGTPLVMLLLSRIQQKKVI